MNKEFKKRDVTSISSDVASPPVQESPQHVEIILSEYLPLVKRVASFRHRKLFSAGIRHIELAELENEGFCGLVEARDNFDPALNPNFDYYAYTKINFAISRFLRGEDYMSREKRKSLKDLHKYEEELMQQLGRPPLEEELAEVMETTGEKLQEIRMAADRGRPLYEKNQEDERGTILERIPADIHEPGERLDEIDLAKVTNECMKKCLNAAQTLILLLIELRDFSAREVVELVKEDILDLNAVYYQLKVAKKKMSQCLKQKNFQVSDL